MGRSPNKYKAERSTAEGIRFDSKKEAKRWGDLRLLERAGEISNLERQVPLMLEGREGPLLTETGRQMRLTVDFRYKDNRTGLTVWEDAKGFPTEDFKVRRAVALAMGVEVVLS